MRRKGLTSENPRFTKPSKNRFKQRMNFRSQFQPPPQDSDTSHKSEETAKTVKRVRNKQEYIRPGALLPDCIRLNNYISCSCVSSKDFNSQCTLLTRKCMEENDCKAHTSLSNLKKISTNLLKILSQSKKITKDWKKDKKVYLGSYGYLSIAINQPRIWKEIELITSLVKQFNRSRENLWKFRAEIQNKRISKENPLKQ